MRYRSADARDQPATASAAAPNADHPTRDPLDRNRYPIDEWALIETAYSLDDDAVNETLFSVGNGYLGMRDNPPEGRDAHQHGTFINGFHETWKIRHAEEAYGFARTGQTIVNVPDAKMIKLYVDDEPLIVSEADLETYERKLAFDTGVWTRELIWRTPAGKRVKVKTTRMVSLAQRHLAIVTLEATMLDDPAPVVLSSQVLNRQDGFDDYNTQASAKGRGAADPRKASNFTGRVLEPIVSEVAESGRMRLGYRCINSRMTIGVGVDHTITTEADWESSVSNDPDSAKIVYKLTAQPGQTISLTKVISYHTSHAVPVRELLDRCVRTMDRVSSDGIECYYDQQKEMLADFWAVADVRVPHDQAIQQAIRWNLFQLHQASARAEQSGIAAKGVSGNGYEGHYFWDTEIYVLPFLSYTQPHTARNALRFRYRMLDAARQRAGELAQYGALFPWRTINGEEASAYYAAGTAQYHIDADIAYALTKYVSASGDEDFMVDEGVDIMVETARLWADLGFWRLTNGSSRFEIHGVTGPDEYTTVVNNNLFTNIMARDNLRNAADLVRRIEQTSPDGFARLVDRLDLSPDEATEWEAAARGMVIPFDENLGIHPQDEHFLDREVWDLQQTPPENRPLLLHYHPLVIYRFQVLKQADVCMALFLQGDQFTPEEKRADFEYYDPITTGDSSLSAVVQSIIASEVGYTDMAVNYFHRALYVDLADLQHNASDGVHVASTGGVWEILVYGFAGMRDHGGKLAFDPRLPASWPKLEFSLLVRGNELHCVLETDQLTITNTGESAVRTTVRGTEHEIAGGTSITVALPDQGPVVRGCLGNTPVIGGRRADGSLITAGVPTDPATTSPGI